MQYDTPIPKEAGHVEGLLTTRDVARQLNISITTVYRLIESRKLIFYRVSGSLRFKQSDVNDYLQRNQVGSFND